MLWFVLKLAVILLVYYGIIFVPYWQVVLIAYLDFSAQLSSFVLNLLGQHTSVTGYTITAAEANLEVHRGCDGLEVMWFLLAAILAYPWANIRRKILGVMAGISFLFFLNISRILSLFFIRHYYRPLFDSIHSEIWPAVFIIIMMFLFLRWLKWETPHEAVT